jgi:hypothetical protein
MRVEAYNCSNVLHNLLRGAPRAGVLADGLLSKNGGELGAFDSGNVTGRRQTQPVAKSKGGSKRKGGEHIGFQKSLKSNLKRDAARLQP